MARKFNGTSDRILVNGALTKPNWFADQYAFAVWVKGAAQSNKGIYSEGQSTSNTSFWWIGSDSSSTSKMRWTGSNQPAAQITTATVFDNTWHHYALTVSGNKINIYVDGLLDIANINAGALDTGIGGTNANLATIGALGRSTYGSFFAGLIAHMAVWNRPLSAEEIRMLARGALPSRFRPKNYWPLTGPDLEAAKDLGARHNHGTLVGTTVSADVPPLVGQPRPVRWVQRFALGAIPPPAGVTLVVPDSAQIQILSDPPILPAIPPSAQIQILADDATSIPLTALSASIEIRADPPALAGPAQPPSARIEILADPPTTVGPAQVSASGVVQIKADAPKLLTGLKPPSGQIQIKADPPTLIPVQPPSAKIQVKSDSPTSSPSLPQSGRIVIKADPPTVYPLQVPTGARIVIAAGTDTVAETGLVAKQSGIIRILADPPTITPYDEPPTEPPPEAGRGISGVVRA